MSGTERRLLSGLLPWLALGCGPTQTDGSQAWFLEESRARGIDYRHVSGFAGRFLIPEITGSGGALADLDGDGDLDAYIVQSGSVTSPSDVSDRVYLNMGDGRFQAGAAPPGANGYGMGVAAGDYDNDGDVDLYVTNVGENLLLRNDGSGGFTNVASAAGVASPAWGTSAAFLDLDLDGDLDLFVANYIQWRVEAELACYMSGVLTYCPPLNYNAPAPDQLFRNNGDGTFTDVSRRAGLHLAFGNGFGVVGADYNSDGLTDVFVANDMMVNQLWLNQGDLRFAESAMEWGCGVDASGAAKAGMGVAAADVDDDADMDILVVNLEGQTDSLYRNAGRWFDDATAEVGLNVVSRRYTRFGVVLADFDNDGRLDLYQANGAIAPVPGQTGDYFAEPNVLYRGGEGGIFDLDPREGGTPEPLVDTSRGLAVGDVDNDGGMDLLVINRDAAPYLLMNSVPERGNWMRFRVLTRTGRDAHVATVSARIDGKRQYRDVQPAASYLSSNDPRVHFGLADSEGVTDVRVRWPDGTVEAFGDFVGGRTVQIQEGAGSEVVGP
ncbi:MAG: CRTAC1 family protein [Gammaproteobacteria bacterium]|nr:CRTAC1 family protein [Gammaproteobacteria bacterium]